MPNLQVYSLFLSALSLGRGTLGGICADPLSLMGHMDPTTTLRRIGQVEYDHVVMLSPLSRISPLRPLDL